MNSPGIPHHLWWLVTPFVAWRVVVRLRRLLAHQRYSWIRQSASVIGLSVAIAGVVVVVIDERASLLPLALGLGVGATLGAVGIRITAYDVRSDGLYYRPNRFLGSALSLLLLGRITWRLVAGPAGGGEWTADQFVHNQSTLLLFGLFSAHYLVYALGLLTWASWRLAKPPTTGPTTTPN